jgi:two-component system, OmpR family, response regulator VicR
MAQGSQILYIEDERTTFDLVSQALKPLGYRVTRATSGKQGLAMMKKQKPDLLLLDLMMPDINGWDVFRTIKSDETLADLPIIVISARLSEHERTIIADLPRADEYIIKPFDVEQVIRAVQKFV